MIRKYLHNTYIENMQHNLQYNISILVYTCTKTTGTHVVGH